MEEIEFKIIKGVIEQNAKVYFEKYGENPRFIKMPEYMLEVLKQKLIEIATCYERQYEDEDLEEFSFMGMKVCPTKSINMLDEIEVF